jgi:hypothetical protein
MYYRHLTAVCVLAAVLVLTSGCCWRRWCRPDPCCRPCFRPACCGDTMAFYPPSPVAGTSFGNPASVAPPTGR